MPIIFYIYVIYTFCFKFISFVKFINFERGGRTEWPSELLRRFRRVQSPVRISTTAFLCGQATACREKETAIPDWAWQKPTDAQF